MNDMALAGLIVGAFCGFVLGYCVGCKFTHDWYKALKIEKECDKRIQEILYGKR